MGERGDSALRLGVALAYRHFCLGDVRDDLVLHAHQVALQALYPLRAGVIRDQQHTEGTWSTGAQ
jgi:hypothetical protein